MEPHSAMQEVPLLRWTCNQGKSFELIQDVSSVSRKGFTMILNISEALNPHFSGEKDCFLQH